MSAKVKMTYTISKIPVKQCMYIFSQFTWKTEPVYPQKKELMDTNCLRKIYDQVNKTWDSYIFVHVLVFFLNFYVHVYIQGQTINSTLYKMHFFIFLKTYVKIPCINITEYSMGWSTLQDCWLFIWHTH